MVAALGLAGCSGGSTGSVMGDRAIRSVEVVAKAGAFKQPLDAAPSPDGAVVYFAATGDAGSGIFSVLTGGGDVSTVTVGAPFVRPSSVAVATDGSRVYAADRRAGPAEAEGAILTAPTSGGPQSPTVLDGTQGRSPRGLDVVHRGGADILYFTGTDPANGSPGVFRIPAGGGPVSTVAEGAPFASADSVVVTAHDVAYVSDRGAAPGQGQVLRASGGTATPVLTGLSLGAPAGVTLIHDDKTLLVSTVDAKTSSDQVLFVDLATGKRATATKVIGANSDSSGGLHRAYAAAVLAWCDTNGQVYRVNPR
jgi:DNA-binding beta-propeller fold protein YncE